MDERPNLKNHGSGYSKKSQKGKNPQNTRKNHTKTKQGSGLFF
jgi:hypothetical protein